MKDIREQVLSRTLDNSLVMVLVGLCLAAGILSDRFLTGENWFNILNNFAVTGIVSFGVAAVMIAGGIDLSFGSILACCAVLAAALHSYPFVVPLAAAVLLGGLLGGMNGCVVAYAGVNPLIATLGTQWLYLAALLIVTGGGLVHGGSDGFIGIVGQGRFLSVPVPVYILLFACAVTAFVLRRTRFGRHLYAHGSNAGALTCAGVDARRVYARAFVFMGVLVGLAGLVLSARLVGVRPTEGGRYLLTVLTAVILGGVSLHGGTGSIFQVLIAVLVLGVIDNAMVLFAIPYKDQQVIRGVVFIASVLYNNAAVRWRESLLRARPAPAEG